VSDARDEGLLRVIGLGGLTGSVINVVIGGGIFALPAALAATLGPASPLAFLLGAAVMGLVTLSLARAGSRVARSGGIYGYALEAFGPLAGFLTGVLFLSAGVLSNASIAAALVDSLSLVAPAAGHPVGRGMALVGLYAGLAWVNLRGVATGTRVAAGLAIVKFGALSLFVLLGIGLMRPEHLAWHATPAADALGRSAILGIFAFAGMEIALGASGEVRDPARTIPRALVLAMTLIVLLYVAIQLVAQGVLGPDLAASRAPLAEALGRGWGQGREFMLVLGAVSMLGWMAGDVLGVSRQFFAFAREGFLPGALAAINARTRVPHVAILCYAAMSCTLAITGTFAGLAILASVAVILLYLSGCAAAWWLARETRSLPWLVPSLASVGLLWVLSSATGKEFLAVAGVLGASLLLYWLTRTRRRTETRAAPDAG
jgi:basic amino acid/polyamine antiporter, APA family